MSDDWTSISRRRMAHQGLTAPLGSVGQIADTVRAMCGAHAQIQSAAEHSVSRRLEGVTRADVQASLWERHELVRTYGPRGTVHLLPTADLHLWVGALSTLDGGTPRHADGVRLDGGQVEEVVAAVGEALADAELTLPELDAEIATRLEPWASEETMPAFQTFWPRWRQAITVAAHRGALCFGRPRGRSATYTSPARWLPGFAPAPAEVAVPWLLEHYLSAYGPAEPRHLARWLATSESWAREAWTSTDQGEITSPTGSVVGDVPDVLLLPYFDAYVVAAQPREQLFPGRAWERALAGSQAGNYPVLLVQGVVGGVWHGKRSGSRLAVRVEPLEPLTDAQRLALAQEVARVGEILQARTELTVGQVVAGPHA